MEERKVESLPVCSVDDAYGVIITTLERLVNDYKFKYVNDGKVDNWLKWRPTTYKDENLTGTIVYNHDSVNCYWNIYSKSSVETLVLKQSLFDTYDEFKKFMDELNKSIKVLPKDRFVEKEEVNNAFRRDYGIK